jgi:hypothetical protein
MACKKSELVSAINSFASARASGDGNLMRYSAALVEQFVNTLEYAPEEVAEEVTEETEEG